MPRTHPKVGPPVKDGWYTKVAGVARLYGPVKYLRTAMTQWPQGIHQRFEEGTCVACVDCRPIPDASK